MRLPQLLVRWPILQAIIGILAFIVAVAMLYCQHLTKIREDAKARLDAREEELDAQRAQFKLWAAGFPWAAAAKSSSRPSFIFCGSPGYAARVRTITW
jgi:hypothetical protein